MELWSQPPWDDDEAADEPNTLRALLASFFHQDMRATLDAGNCQLEVQVGRRGDGEGIDAGAEQTLHVREAGAAERVRDKFALAAVRIGDPDELYAREVGKHAGMVLAHDADAHHTHAHEPVSALLHGWHGLHHGCASFL